MFYRNFEIFFFNSIMDQDLRTLSNVSIGVLLMKLQVFEICVFMGSKSKHPIFFEKLTQPGCVPKTLVACDSHCNYNGSRMQLEFVGRSPAYFNIIDLVFDEPRPRRLRPSKL